MDSSTGKLLNWIKCSARLVTVLCSLPGFTAIGQSASSGMTTYNDFGKPSLKNNLTSQVGCTLAELKNSDGTIVKTGTLFDINSNQITDITIKLTVTGSPLSQAEIGGDAPSGTEASKVFKGKINCEGGTPLPAGKVHFIDLQGLNPAKLYELVLFSSVPIGNEPKPVSHTLWDVSSFENQSFPNPNRVTISGQLNRTTTIETTGNDNIARGDVCRFAFIESGADGDLRVILQSPNGGQLNALMLREQSPPILAGKPVIELGENYAVIHATVNDTTNGSVELHWRKANNNEKWQSRKLAPDEDGKVKTRLDSLPEFVNHEFVFVQSTPVGEITSEPLFIRPQKTGIIYSTGFEPTEPTAFLPGEITTQTGPWRVAKGRAEVQSERIAHGGQAVRTGDCIIEMKLNNPAQILWTDAFIQDPGINQVHKIPDGRASSVLLFHDGQLLALDGDGNGGGKFVTASKISDDRFTRLSIRTNYKDKLFDVWVDGKRAVAGLRFKDDSITQFHGAKRLAGASSYLDDFSLSTWGLDRDSDGDGLNDLDEAKFYGSYPLLADSDRDGASDAHEIASGTHPANPQSIFAVKIDSVIDGKTRLSIPTITGLEYTLQRRTSLGQGQWQTVPGFENMPGDGSVQSFLETPDGRNYFYRGVIVNRLNPVNP